VTKPRKLYEFQNCVFVDPDIMWALRNKYGVKGLAEKAEIGLSGLHQQFDKNSFQRPEAVRDRLVKLYENIGRE